MGIGRAGWVIDLELGFGFISGRNGEDGDGFETRVICVSGHFLLMGESACLEIYQQDKVLVSTRSASVPYPLREEIFVIGITVSSRAQAGHSPARFKVDSLSI